MLKALLIGLSPLFPYLPIADPTPTVQPQIVETTQYPAIIVDKCIGYEGLGVSTDMFLEMNRNDAYMIDHIKGVEEFDKFKTYVIVLDQIESAVPETFFDEIFIFDGTDHEEDGSTSRNTIVAYMRDGCAITFSKFPYTIYDKIFNKGV